MLAYRTQRTMILGFENPATTDIKASFVISDCMISATLPELSSARTSRCDSLRTVQRFAA
jgi:hypothetical protein